MVELTDEQRQALEECREEPVRAIDRVTSTEYVLIDRKTYDRIRDLLPNGPNPTLRQLPTAMRQSKQAYLRDLPTLLKDAANWRHWVAYAGDEQVGIGPSETILYEHCRSRGLRLDEFYVGMIVPLIPEPESVDPSPTEFVEYSA